jgi:hypothetical protein
MQLWSELGALRQRARPVVQRVYHQEVGMIYLWIIFTFLVLWYRDNLLQNRITDLKEDLRLQAEENMNMARTMAQWDKRQCSMIDDLRRSCNNYQVRIARLEGTK